MRFSALAVLLTALVSAIALRPAGMIQDNPPDRPSGCIASGTSYMRTTLYFGLTRKAGRISESQWQAFLREKVTPRFPDGLTVWEADGQWRRPDGRIGKERAKVLLLVHNESAQVRTALADIIRDYKHDFQQESVLWESAPVCAAF